MPDPICHMTQGGLMLVAPFLKTVRRKRTLATIATLGALAGDLPDLIGVFGVLFEHDNGRLYQVAHTGFIKDVLQYIPMYWLHIFLDSFTHSMEDRWSFWNDWVGFEAVAWAINIILIAWFVHIWRKGSRRRHHRGWLYYLYSERLQTRSVRAYRRNMNGPK